MRSKARPLCISMLAGVLMLPAYSTDPVGPEPAAAPFFQTIQTQAAISRSFAALFRFAQPQGKTVSAGESAPAPATTTVVAKEGQSLWDIAGAHGVSVEAIVAANNLPKADLIRSGQRLMIPRAAATRPAQKTAGGQTPTKAAPSSKARKVRRSSPTWVVVAQGQTLSEIADAHGTSVRAIVSANGLRSAEVIRAGQRLMIPGQFAPRAGRVVIASPVPVPRAQAVVAGVSFLWPARGVLTSRFGWRWRRHHDGIDIAGPRGTPIYAARAGRVIFAGWYYGYGRTVIMDHGQGLVTLYGHASTLLVRNGQTVAEGELIARIGCTGHCSGSHLHFEIRINGKAVNPLKYL